MENGSVLFEQNADCLIAPASITKILTLYLIFEALKQGDISLSDKVEVSIRAASTGGSRMGLRAGTFVPMEEIIKGIAVVSGNDACVAAAEHVSGSVERFVRRMNGKARELGMNSSRFMTPNGLPADGQVTTARDIARLSLAYLRRFPESLAIHSMQSYTYGRHTHHNANRLLGKCPGVDGLKTGFVCASGYNISATARRNHTRIVAVVMGARNPWIRCSEAERLIEAGFRETGAPYNEVHAVALKTAPKKRPVLTQRVKNGAKRNRLARAHEKLPVPVKQASNAKKKTRNSVKGSTVKSVKSACPNAVAKNKSARAKSAAVKSGAAKAGKGRDRVAKSVKRNKDTTRRASRKKNNKGVSRAHDLKKRAKG
jgi:D-alanyl-D-alanine carboxypeptidase (penicillin-binding protein 5/6)